MARWRCGTGNAGDGDGSDSGGGGGAREWGGASQCAQRRGGLSAAAR